MHEHIYSQNVANCWPISWPKFAKEKIHPRQVGQSGQTRYLVGQILAYFNRYELDGISAERKLHTYTKSNPSCCQKTSSHEERLSLRQYRKRIAPVRRTSAPRLRPALRAAPSAGLVNGGVGFDSSQTPHSQTPHSRTSLRRSAETCALSNPLDYSRSSMRRTATHRVIRPPNRR